jgi:hypothetical protein
MLAKQKHDSLIKRGRAVPGCAQIHQKLRCTGYPARGGEVQSWYVVYNSTGISFAGDWLRSLALRNSGANSETSPAQA